MATLPQFPNLLGLAFPVVRRNLGFDVVKMESISGVRSRYALRDIPQYQWEVSFEFLRDFALVSNTTFSDGTFFSDGSDFVQNVRSEFEQLMGFYNNLRGAQSPFIYTDTADNSVTNQRFGTGDGQSVNFQLVRTFGGFTEPVYAPTANQSAIVTISGVLQPSTAYTIGPTGTINFKTAPSAGAALAWAGSFGWLCQFDDDSIEFSNFMGGFWEAKSIKFSNLVLP